MGAPRRPLRLSYRVAESLVRQGIDLHGRGTPMRNAVLLFVLVAIAACGTRLSTLDARAVGNQVRLCQALEHETDSGVMKLQAEGCYCGGRGILARAGVPMPEGGTVTCPK